MFDYKNVRRMDTDSFDEDGNLVITGNVLTDIQRLQTKLKRLEGKAKFICDGVPAPEFEWAIFGNLYGLYYGTWRTRHEAIVAHADALGISWQECRKKGDRAIKVLVIPEQALKGE